MLRNDAKNLSFKDKDQAMHDTDTAVARGLLREAFPANRYGKVEAALYAAWRFLKPHVEPRIKRPFTLRRVRSLHEGKANRVDGAELEALNLAKTEEVRREYHELKGRLEELAAALAIQDQAGSGPSLGAHRQA